ncbi:hypothetical protein EIP86_010119 [Pleurotus ostreatoroseus]|nr:hypothetical protein EIP86_010119 [Pleurotus ostreatoroseus]
MTVSTTSAAIHIAPVVLKTLFKHAKNKTRKLRDGDKTAVATDDVFFDEAFHIVKAFIDMGTHNTIESLQAFTNTHVPAPPWAAVSPVQVPLPSCNKAADLLIEWFGPEDLNMVVGGERWWQIRGLDGVDAEWITQKEFLSDKDVDKEGKLSTEDANILRMEHLETVLLYVHGGAYFWGSINTHRYQIIRYDSPSEFVLKQGAAEDLYLTNPPEGALHKPIPPSKIVMAGDSAGAGLCVSVLTVLRDLGVELPAGAVLISPWVDLTHSFPSVMKNTETDIIPPYGFIHKPSPLWPMDLLPKEGDARAVQAQTNPPPMPGHADTLKPSDERVSEQAEQQMEQGREEGRAGPVSPDELQDDTVSNQKEMLKEGPQVDNPKASNGHEDRPKPSEEKPAHQNGKHHEEGPHVDDDASSDWSTIKGSIKDLHEDDPSYEDALSFWEPKPPKVLMANSEAIPLELHAQIQMYATNEQLSHPLVSPVLQGSLGNLCPLYIIAGDGEVLRDEIIYLAHKAAHPKEYPTRKGVLHGGRRQRENAEKFTTPTKAKYAYRSIAEFAKHVTQNPPEHVALNPFPELHRPPADIPDESSSSDEDYDDDPVFPHAPKSENGSSASSTSSGRFSGLFKRERRPAPPPSSKHQDIRLYEANEEKLAIEVKEGKVEVGEGGSSGESTPQPVPSPEQSSNATSTSETSGKPPPSKPETDVPNVIMIRERVDIYGRVRPMESKEEIEALHVPPRQIGIIKETPVRRWLKGQEAWDRQYKHVALKMMKTRVRYEHKYAKLLERAKEQGLELHKHATKLGPAVYRQASRESTKSELTVGEIDVDRRWAAYGDQVHLILRENILRRLQSLVDMITYATFRMFGLARLLISSQRESIALAKKNIYFTAPVTHKRVPKRSTGDAVKAAFDPDDHPLKPPPQSVSEQQTESHAIPGMHGLHIWQSLVS